MSPRAAGAARSLSITAIEHRGRAAFLLGNGVVAATVVPSIARVMQFGFCGERGVFWENDRGRDGEWDNYGGDKAWPAPQDQWLTTFGTAWPPPAGFDAVPFAATVDADQLVMASPVDTASGIQITRQISLDPFAPVMTITTSFSKVCGAPYKVGVWVVTQLRVPDRVFAPLPSHGSLPVFQCVMGSAQEYIRIDGDLLSLRRPPSENLKVTLGGSSLAWIDFRHLLRIDTHPACASLVPSGVAIYTNKDPLGYVELETEGAIATLTPGDRLTQVNTYTLGHRTTPDPAAEARRIFRTRASSAEASQ